MRLADLDRLSRRATQSGDGQRWRPLNESEGIRVPVPNWLLELRGRAARCENPRHRRDRACKRTPAILASPHHEATLSTVGDTDNGRQVISRRRHELAPAAYANVDPTRCVGREGARRKRVRAHHHVRGHGQLRKSDSPLVANAEERAASRPGRAPRQACVVVRWHLGSEERSRASASSARDQHHLPGRALSLSASSLLGCMIG